MDEQELDEIGKQVYAEIAEAEAENERQLVAAITRFDATGLLAIAIDEYREHLGYMEFRGVVTEVTGNRQDSDIDHFSHEYVDQTCNGGYNGDDYAGMIYLPVTETEYLAFYYSC